MESLYNEVMKVILGRSILILLFLYFSFQLIFPPSHWIFLDGVNLLFHEAGHLLLLPFGGFLHILGGSLLQILIPILFIVYFLKRKEYFSTSVMLFWLADNIINVSIYMSDAIPMRLPLLGGDGVIHDWNWLFSTTGLLPISVFIGQSFFFLGAVLLFGSMAGMFFFTIKDVKKNS